jgi:hypothetical protein
MSNTLAQFSGRIYPDKSLSIGICPIKRKRQQDRVYEHQLRQQKEWGVNDKINWLIGDVKVGGKFCSLRESPLFIKSLKSSQARSNCYGAKGITRYGKKVCTNSALLLEQKYTLKRVGFATCTLPSVDKETSLLLLDFWGDIVRRFLQRLKRICNKKGQDFLYVGCTEIQEKRFKRTLIAAPHLHIIYVSKYKRTNQYLFNTTQAYEAWNKSVNEVLVKNKLKEIMGVNGHTGSVKLERIYKSAAGYIGKYISKGSQCVKSMQEQGYKVFPRQWWFASMQMKKMFAQSIIRLTHEECKAFFYGCEHYLEEEVLTWYSFVDVKFNNQKINVGIVGRLSQQAYLAFKT